MAPTTPSLINPSLRTNGGDDGAAGALASATSAEKNQGSRAPRWPKVSNNFGSVPTRRNPARGAKIDGSVAEAEVAGGSPRKKPHGPSPRKKPRGEETFLLRLDRAKATAERGRTEPIGLEDPQGDPQGDPDDRTETGGLSEGGRPEKVPPRTTNPPPVTQEDAGADDLDSEEEELDGDDDDDDGLKRRSVVHERTDGGRPKEGDEEALDAARDEATRASIPDRPRGTSKRDGSENDLTDDDDEELDAA
jgi:hypothetical protein